MLFKSMVAKTFSLRTNHFALNIISIAPTEIEPILTFLRDLHAAHHNIEFLELFNFVCIHMYQIYPPIPKPHKTAQNPTNQNPKKTAFPSKTYKKTNKFIREQVNENKTDKYF